MSLVGDGCCGSNYNSFQLTATKRFTDGGTFLAAYTNAKLLSNTDTLTTWLETGVGEAQDWNNLKGREVALFAGCVPASGDQLRL